MAWMTRAKREHLAPPQKSLDRCIRCDRTLGRPARIESLGLQLKRISPYRQMRLAELAKHRHRHDVRRRNVKRGVIERATTAKPSGFYSPPRYARKLTPPEHFDFDKDAEGVLQWLNFAFNQSTDIIRNRRRRRPSKRRSLARVKGYYDFTKIKTMTPAAALIVAAFFDRHRQLAGVPIYVYDYDRWDPQVRETLAQVGFFELLGVPNPASQPAPPNSTKIERFTSEGRLRPGEVGRLIETLLGYILAAHPGCLSDEQQIERTAKLFGALIEATENTRFHAYPADTHRGYGTLPNWWLTGSVDPTQRRLTLIVYDQGISVPGSLASYRSSKWPGHGWINGIIRRFSKGSFDPDDTIADHAKVRLAMKMGISSTGEEHRGKGLPVVRQAITHCDRARLHILSRNGAYLEETGKRAVSWHLKSPMIGTLIVWDLWL